MTIDNSKNNRLESLSLLKKAHDNLIDVDTMLNTLAAAKYDENVGHMCELIIERNGVASGAIEEMLGFWESKVDVLSRIGNIELRLHSKISVA